MNEELLEKDNNDNKPEEPKAQQSVVTSYFDYNLIKRFRNIIFYSFSFVIFGSFKFFLQIFPKHVRLYDATMSNNKIINLILFFTLISYLCKSAGLLLKKMVEKYKIKIENLIVISLSGIIISNVLLIIKSKVIIYISMPIFCFSSSVPFIFILEKIMAELPINKGLANGVIIFFENLSIIIYFLIYNYLNHILYLMIVNALIFTGIFCYFSKKTSAKDSERIDFSDSEELKDIENDKEPDKDKGKKSINLFTESRKDTVKTDSEPSEEFSNSMASTGAIQYCLENFTKRYMLTIAFCCMCMEGSYLLSLTYIPISAIEKHFSGNSTATFYLYFFGLVLSSLFISLFYDLYGMRPVMLIYIIVASLSSIFLVAFLFYSWILPIISLVNGFLLGIAEGICLPILYKEVPQKSNSKNYYLLIGLIFCAFVPCSASLILTIFGGGLIKLYVVSFVAVALIFGAGFIVHYYLYPETKDEEQNDLNNLESQDKLRDIRTE